MFSEKGAIPEATESNKDTALHTLVRGHSYPSSDESRWNSTAIEMLLGYNANVCLANDAVITALHLAAQHAVDSYDFDSVLARCLKTNKAVAALTNNSQELLLRFAALGGNQNTKEILISSHSIDLN